MSDTTTVSAGELALDAFHDLGGFTRGITYDSLHPSTQRLWELGAVAAISHRAIEAGKAFYEGYIEATGLPKSNFLGWEQLGPSVRRQWSEAGAAARFS